MPPRLVLRFPLPLTRCSPLYNPRSVRPPALSPAGLAHQQHRDGLRIPLPPALRRVALLFQIEADFPQAEPLFLPESCSELRAAPGGIPQQTTGHLGFGQQQVPSLTVKTACVHAHAGIQRRTKSVSTSSCGA